MLGQITGFTFCCTMLIPSALLRTFSSFVVSWSVRAKLAIPYVLQYKMLFFQFDRDPTLSSLLVLPHTTFVALGACFWQDFGPRNNWIRLFCKGRKLDSHIRVDFRCFGAFVVAPGHLIWLPSSLSGASGCSQAVSQSSRQPPGTLGDAHWASWGASGSST